MVSHEIRTPLNAVSGAAALLAATSLDAEQRELVALLEAGTTHVVLIVDDILIAGALASGAFAVARERLCLAARVLDPAWRMVALQRTQRDKLQSLRLSRTMAEGVPEEIVGDSTRLTQGEYRSCACMRCLITTDSLAAPRLVITNIVSNSVKFTPAGGAITLQIDVTLEPPARCAPAPDAMGQQPPARWLRFRVTDTGIGIAAGALCIALCSSVLRPERRFLRLQKIWSACFSPLSKRSSPPFASTAALGLASRCVPRAVFPSAGVRSDLSEALRRFVAPSPAPWAET